MQRIRLLQDGRYVERDNSGVMYFRQPDGALIEKIERNGETYVLLGLRPQYDDRALLNPMDPSTTNDPHALVWIGSLGRYGTRDDSNVEKYGSSTPSDEAIERGGHLPPVGTQPKSAPPPAPAVPAPPAPAVPARASLWRRILEWLRRRFG
jgi:hypothetical protein